MMYLKPANASRGLRVPDEAAYETAQTMADNEGCRVVICKELPFGVTIPVGSAEPLESGGNEGGEAVTTPPPSRPQPIQPQPKPKPKRKPK